MDKKSPKRLQKVLADLGYGSRRKIENSIISGKITINGKIAVLGDRIEGNETIVIDNKIVSLEKSKDEIIMYNKPVGEICTVSDPDHRNTVFDKLPLLPPGSRWVMVGRLDINSQGLLLFTTNGDYANKLMHPKHKIPRVYKIRVSAELSQQQLAKLKAGVRLHDGFARFDNISHLRTLASNSWYRVTISSGKNRIIRRLIATQNMNVSKLIRVSYGKYKLPLRIKPGTYEYTDFIQER
ncbi:MAG: pseudouridine synthase [Pseudomonadota bacterium]|nr:pseudouridine synthase [Pseudomonadota bacterium]